MYCDVTENVITTMNAPTDELEPFQTATMTCIALSDQLIFVDCGIIPSIALQFRSDMEKRFQRKPSHLLLTHMHWDHIFAMEAFEDVIIVSSKVGVQNLKRKLKGMYSKERREKIAKKRFKNQKEMAECFKNAKLFLPHIGVKEELSIGPEGDIIFQVIGGHSSDSACIYYPAERILCTGDNLLTCYAQLPGNPDKTLEILRYWESLDIDWVVPGHGHIVGKEYIGKVRMYFEELLSVLKALKAQNISQKDVLNHPNLPQYFLKELPEWREGSTYHTRWLEMNITSWYKWVVSKCV